MLEAQIWKVPDNPAMPFLSKKYHPKILSLQFKSRNALEKEEEKNYI